MSRVKIALIVGSVMALLYVLMVYSKVDSVGMTCGFLLDVPGILLFAPYVLARGHNSWDGVFSIAPIINWMFYTYLIHWILARRWRRNKAASQEGAGKSLPRWLR